MHKMKNFLKAILSCLPFFSTNQVVESETDNDAFWQKVYETRVSYYESQIGELPDDILKMGNMTGVWPGGGLFVFQADKIGKDLWAYSTFGMSNPDMPANMVMTDYEVETDDQGRVSQYRGSLEAKEQKIESVEGLAGYGYEVLLFAKEKAEWPLWFIQWSVNAEILNDAGILEKIEKYNGLTVEGIPVGENESINVLIAKAEQPLPTYFKLPNGKMNLLVATVITDEEMKWSMGNGREELLSCLVKSGVGQVSDRNRKSVVFQ